MSTNPHASPLAVALFEAFARNGGNSPADHFDRNAAEQWMQQALDECMPQPTAAQEAVAWGAFEFGGDRNGRLYIHADTEARIDDYIRAVHQSNDSLTLGKGKLYAAPVIAATAWAEGYASGVIDERTSDANIGVAGFGAKIDPARENPYLFTAPVAAAPAGSLSPLSRIADAFGVTGTWDQIADAVIVRSTPAAPRIDLTPIKLLVLAWRHMEGGNGSMASQNRKDAFRRCANELEKALKLIDASPKGGIEPVATLTIGEAGGEGTQPYFLDRIRETEAFGNLKPGTYQLAVCSMHPTSHGAGVSDG